MLVAAFLSGCSTASGFGGASPSRDWLIGGWVPAGAHCESDAGISFRADGSWIAYQEAGTWTLAGNLLSTATTRRWESGEGKEEKLAVPERHSQRITAEGNDAYRSHQPGGEVLEMRRCPPPAA